MFCCGNESRATSLVVLLEVVNWNVKIWKAKHNINNEYYVVAVLKMLNSNDEFFVSYFPLKKAPGELWRQNKSKEGVEEKYSNYGNLSAVRCLLVLQVSSFCEQQEKWNETCFLSEEEENSYQRKYYERVSTWASRDDILKLNYARVLSENGPFPSERKMNNVKW